MAAVSDGDVPLYRDDDASLKGVEKREAAAAARRNLNGEMNGERFPPFPPRSG